jgi:calcineurin-like phosphoesterase family protein
MNEALIRRWNERVDPADEVWVLGDFALGRIADSLACGLRLNGRKSLVVGNHDRMFGARRESEYREWVERYADEAGFAQVVGNVAARIGDVSVQVSHFPYQGDSHDADRFDDARPDDDGRWLLHGHVHEKWKVNGRQINVGVDVWGFAPVAEHELERIIRHPA